MRWLVILLLTGCASKFAPVVSRPDNLVIECETKCKFNIPMNTEIVVAKNTNGYDMGIAALKQLPFIGALALSWKSMDVAEDIAEKSIESFNRGALAANGPSTVTNSTTTNTSGDTITSGDVISTETDSSGSGNITSGDVSTSTESIEVGGDNAGTSLSKSEVLYSNNPNNSNQGNNP